MQRTRFLWQTPHPLLRLLHAALPHLKASRAAARLHPARGAGIRPRSSGSPAEEAGAGVEVVDGWGSPPHFRDRPVCGKQQFTGLKSTFFLLLRYPELPVPAVPEEPEQRLERARRDADLHRRGSEAAREGAQHPQSEHSTGRES